MVRISQHLCSKARCAAAVRKQTERRKKKLDDPDVAPDKGSLVFNLFNSKLPLSPVDLSRLLPDAMRYSTKPVDFAILPPLNVELFEIVKVVDLQQPNILIFVC